MSVDAILDASSELLRESGFARLTTNHIAERAGVNVALVYRYFAGKEAIVAALIERIAEQTYATAKQVLTEQAQAPFASAVRTLLVAMSETPQDPDLHRELVELVDVTKQRQHLQALRAKLGALLSEFLDQRSHELRNLRDREATAFALLYAVEAVTHAASFYRPADLSRDRVLDALNEIVLRTLLPVSG
jgi:AcrR family transcriptional regulator